MARQFRAGADQHRLGPAPDFHGIIGDEAMPPHDQVERALALADAALADDQDAKSQDVEQHPCTIVRSARRSSRRDDSLAIACGVGTQLLKSGQRAVRLRRAVGRRREPPVITTQGKSALSADASRDAGGRRLLVLEIAHFALPEDEDTAWLEIFVKSREGESRLLDVRAGNDRSRPWAPASSSSGRPTYRAGRR